MTMTFQRFVRHSEGRLVLGELPDDDRFVSGGGKDHVWKHGRRSDLSNPSIVAFQGSAECELFCHFQVFVCPY